MTDTASQQSGIHELLDVETECIGHEHGHDAKAAEPRSVEAPSVPIASDSTRQHMKPLRWKPGKTAKRRAAPIRAYVGRNGSGKTLAAIKDLEPSIRAGRRILSTVRILDPYTGGDYAGYERLTDWAQVLDARSTDLVFDEVLGIANSRTSAGMPVQVQVLLNQLRRNDLTLSWTAPSWSRADVVIREVTQAVTVARGYFPKTKKVQGEDSAREWAGNRLFRWITYDAGDFTTWTDSKEGQLKGICNEWMRGPGSLAFARYNTLDAVDRIGEVLDSGRCAHCGGVRRAPACRCG